MFSKVKKLTTLLAAGLIAGGIGCGDAGSNNDQGTSVTATGYCANSDCSLFESIRIVPLATDVSNINAGGFPIDGQTVITIMKVENRLTSQFVRLVRIDCRYDVPGSDPGLNIPNDSFAANLVISATPAAGPGTANSFATTAFEIVSPDLFAFLNANRLSLPELPFRATALCRAVGVTQSGDTIETNEIGMALQFGEVSECCTGQNPPGEVPGSSSGGFQNGAGTGGNLNTFSQGSEANNNQATTAEATTDDGVTE